MLRICCVKTECIDIQELENDDEDDPEDDPEELEQLMEQMDKNFEEYSTQTASQKVLPSGAMPTSQNGKLSEHAAEFWFPECRECQCCKGFKHGCNCVKQDSFIACQHETCIIDPSHVGQKVSASPRRPPSSSPRNLQRSNSGGSRGPNVCKFESMPGGCRFGSNCRFQHVMGGGRGGRSGGQNQFSSMRQSSDPGPSLGGGQRPYSLPTAPHAGYGMNIQYGAPGQGGAGLPLDMYGVPPPPPPGGDPRVHGYPSPQHSPHHLQYPPPHSGQPMMHPGGPGMMGGMPHPHQMQSMPVQQHPHVQHMSIPPGPGSYPPQSPTSGPPRSVSDGAKSDQLCTFFVSGQCRFGANCRNRHN